MFVILAACIGVLVAVGAYLLLRRSLLRVLLGVAVLGHAANLLVFTLGGGVRGHAPIVPEGASAPEPGHADPVSQALVLTAIVIGFAVIAFFSVLIERTRHASGTLDGDELGEVSS